MKVTKKELKNAKIQLVITLDEKDVEKYRKQAIQTISQKVKVPGFRSKNIPEDVLVQHVGEAAILEEMQHSAFVKSYTKAIQDEKIHPIAQPKVELKKLDPLTFEVEVDVFPTITLGKYRDIKVSVKEEKVAQKDIDATLEELKTHIPEFKEVKRAAKKGDIVTIDFAGFTLKDEPVPNTEAKGHKLELGSNSFIPGFEEELIGLKAEEEKTFEITFPKEYHAKEMAGKKYKFKVKVHSIEEKKLPELNEDFVEKITGKKDSVDSLKEEIKKNLEIKKHQEARAKAEEELLEKLAKAVKFDVPEALIHEEEDFLLDNQKMQGLQRGLPWEHYLKSINKTEEDIRKELRQPAEERVRYRLIIQEIIKEEKLTAKEENVALRAKAAFTQLKPEQQKKMKAAYEKGGKQYEQMRNLILVEQVFASYLGPVKR